MGGAIARGLASQGLARRLLLIDPHPTAALTDPLISRGAKVERSSSALQDISPQAIILAIKPQLMPTIAPQYAKASQAALVVSIAAGTTIESLSAHLHSPPSLVRAMPNLPASIGKGMTAAFATPTTSGADLALAEALLGSVGDFVWLQSESMLDAVTAVSGSGPAYVFHLVECLTEAAVKQGLPRETAEILARKTIEGAGALLSQDDRSPTSLRKSVTSPGGTTEAALRVLMTDARLEKAICDAVEAATARGLALSKSS